MNSISAPQTQKISLELPTSLLNDTKRIASEKMISLSAVVRQSLKEQIQDKKKKV
tara:strand:+ start:254 stop:418 length:165 start_codon:yes stop_codon:yes gene_type:complete